MLEKLIAFSGLTGTHLVPVKWTNLLILASHRPWIDPRIPTAKAFAEVGGVEMDFVSGMEFEHGCAVPAITPEGVMGWINPYGNGDMFPTAAAVGKSTYKEEWVPTDDPEEWLTGTRLLDDTLIVSH